jgi:hypothetical protein
MCHLRRNLEKRGKSRHGSREGLATETPKIHQDQEIYEDSETIGRALRRFDWSSNASDV